MHGTITKATGLKLCTVSPVRRIARADGTLVLKKVRDGRPNFFLSALPADVGLFC